MPLDLFDGYIGRLDPRPGQCPALISRYFNRPLLDLTDVGVYVVSLRAEVVPTLRLRHLGLHGAAGVTMPVEPQSLMALAATGRLTTIVGDKISSVSLSFQGQSQHNIGAVAADVSGVDETGSPGRSPGESAGGSSGGSGGGRKLIAPITEHSAGNMATDLPRPLIAWDVGSVHEQINHDSHLASILAGGSESVIRLGEIGSVSCTLAERFERPCAEHSYTSYGERFEASKLADSVLNGHRRLNPGRTVVAGELHELLALQEACGVEQLLVWQARAGRVERERAQGITPAYYRACAAREACSTIQPLSPPTREPMGQVHLDHQGTMPLAPSRDALLSAMGIRERQRLAAVPQELLLTWQQALTHPGMAAQLASPAGFAVAQMRRGQAPPPTAELERWAERARQRADRYECWRVIDPVAGTRAEAEQEQALEARVRAIAPPEADLDELCALASWLEAGATDDAALAQLASARAGATR